MRVKPPEWVLCVDDEPAILTAFERVLRRDFNVVTALGPERGLEALQDKGPFAVVVSDLRMPGMDGIAFLGRAREIAPDTVRMMLTGHADTQAAITAVNELDLFRFLTKPCSPDLMRSSLSAAIEQYRLVTAERVLLEQTLRGSISVLTEVLSLVNPSAFSRSGRLRRWVRLVAEALEVHDIWQLELAAMLSHIGFVAVPPEVLECSQAGGPLSTEEQGMLDRVPQVARDLLVRIPRMEEVAEMVARQDDPPRIPLPAPHPTQWHRPALGAHLLHVVQAYDRLTESGLGPTDAASELLSFPRRYAKQLVSTLHEVAQAQIGQARQEVWITDIRPGMVFPDGVRNTRGLLLLPEGFEATEPVIERLRNFARNGRLAEPVVVMVEGLADPGTDESVDDPVSDFVARRGAVDA